MENTLNLILEKLISMDKRLSVLESDVNNIKATQKEHSESFKSLESKLDIVSNKLDDFESRNAQRHIEIIDKLNVDIEFIKHKEFKNEEDIFKLKKNIQIIK